jgi:hypothetical protein
MKTFAWMSSMATMSLAFALSASPATAATVSLSAAPESVFVGDATNVCVDLADSGGEIVGLQLNMSWDKRCLEPLDARKLCTANATTGKPVHSAAQSNSELKAIVISFTDVDPIPEGEILCCNFKARQQAESCEIRLSDVIGSTAEADRIDGIAIRDTAVAIADAASGAVPAGGNVSDSGCVMVEAPARIDSGVLAGLLFGATLAWAGKRRRRR